jgi:hypothetical protein
MCVWCGRGGREFRHGRGRAGKVRLERRGAACIYAAGSVDVGDDAGKARGWSVRAPDATRPHAPGSRGRRGGLLREGGEWICFFFFYNEERKGWAKGTRKALVNVGLGRTKAEKPKGPRKHTARVNARYMTTRVRASLSSYRLHHTGSLHTQLEASLHSALLLRRRHHHHLRAAAAAGGNLPLGPCRSPPACCHLISAQVTRISPVSYHV